MIVATTGSIYTTTQHAVGCAGNKHAKGKVPAKRVLCKVSMVSTLTVKGWPPGKDEGKDQDRNKAREGTVRSNRKKPELLEPVPHKFLT